jgi:hypothetical protein
VYAHIYIILGCSWESVGKRSIVVYRVRCVLRSVGEMRVSVVPCSCWDSADAYLGTAY